MNYFHKELVKRHSAYKVGTRCMEAGLKAALDISEETDLRYEEVVLQMLNSAQAALVKQTV